MTYAIQLAALDTEQLVAEFAAIVRAPGSLTAEDMAKIEALGRAMEEREK